MQKNNMSLKQMKLNTWGEIQKDRWEKILQTKPKKLLDVGCGKGDYVIELNHKGINAEGIDIMEYPEWRRSAKKFKKGSILDLPYKKKEFDTSICFEVIEHVISVNSALKEIRRVTGSTIIISVPNCEEESTLKSTGLNFNHYTDRSHVNFFTAETLKKSLSTSIKYKSIKIEKINRVNTEKLILQLLGVKSEKARLICSKVYPKNKSRNLYQNLLATIEL